MRTRTIDMCGSDHNVTGRLRLDSLYADHSAAVYGFLIVRCGDQALAADVMSEVFVSAAVAVAGDRPDQVTRSWLLTTARRRLIDQWRRQSTRRKTLTALLRERQHGDEPEEAIDQKRVLGALDSLPTNQRLALTLRYLDARSVSEVADQLDLSYPAAESLLARARQCFRRSWEAQ